MTDFETHPVGTGKRIKELEAKLARVLDALDETRIVLAEHEPHPLPVLSKVLATIAALKGQDDE